MPSLMSIIFHNLTSFILLEDIYIYIYIYIYISSNKIKEVKLWNIIDISEGFFKEFEVKTNGKDMRLFD